MYTLYMRMNELLTEPFVGAENFRSYFKRTIIRFYFCLCDVFIALLVFIKYTGKFLINYSNQHLSLDKIHIKRERERERCDGKLHGEALPAAVQRSESKISPSSHASRQILAYTQARVHNALTAHTVEKCPFHSCVVASGENRSVWKCHIKFIYVWNPMDVLCALIHNMEWSCVAVVNGKFRLE